MRFLNKKKYSQNMGRGSRTVSTTTSLRSNNSRPYLQELKDSIDKELNKLLPELTEKEAAKTKEKYERIYKKISKAEFFYHVAPTSERSRINSHGLQPALPSHNFRWGSGNLDHQPLGVYLVSSEEDTPHIKGILRGTSSDVWKIPADNIKSLRPDWEIINTFSKPCSAVISSSSLDAELHQKYEDTISEESWKVVSKQPYLNLKARRQLKEELKSGEKYFKNLQ